MINRNITGIIQSVNLKCRILKSLDIKGANMKRLLPLTLLVSLIPLALSGCTTEDAIGAGIGAFMFVCWGVLALVGLLLFILWIITLVDCVKRDNSEFPGAGENTKTIWLVILIVTFFVNFWWVAAVVYYFAVMKKMPRKK